MPYRELYTGIGVQEGDPSEVAAAFAARDRFGQLDPNALWPAPPTKPFECAAIDELAVSADGRRALIISDTRAWVLDTTTMIASAPIELPERVGAGALDERGTRAVLACEGVLYRWDLGELGERATFRRVGWTDGDTIQVSGDGRIAIAFTHGARATIGIYDLEACELTASLATDADEAVSLHPRGEHLIAFGDDSFARVYGRDGLQATIKRTSGGAISRDGTLLAMNDLDAHAAIRLYRLDASGMPLLLSPRTQVPLSFEVEWYTTRARFSPSGRFLLIGDEKARIDGHKAARVIDLSTGAVASLGAPMSRRLALLADESLALAPAVTDHELGVRGIGIANATGLHHGVVCVLADRSMMVGISHARLYGSIEANPRPIGGTLAEPYEQPAVMSSVLATGRASLSQEHQLALEESFARSAAWQPYVSQLTAGVSQRELMEINRGLVEVTPVIVSRALAAASAVPRFGPPQLSLDGLRRAAAEIASEPRDEVFARMIEGFRLSLPRR